MNALAKEIADIVDSIPAEKAQTVVEFARFVAERDDAESWQRRLSDSKAVSKLKSMADQALADHSAGLSEDLDPDKL